MYVGLEPSQFTQAATMTVPGNVIEKFFILRSSVAGLTMDRTLNINYFNGIGIIFIYIERKKNLTNFNA